MYDGAADPTIMNCPPPARKGRTPGAPESDPTMARMVENLVSWLRSLNGLQLSWAFVFLTLTLAFEAWAMVRALMRGHGVQGTISWILAILLVPLGGALAYFVIVGPNVKRVALKRRRAAAELRAQQPRTRDSRLAEGDALIDLASSLTGLPPTAGNELELLTDSRPTFEALEADLRAARRSLWVEYYIIRNDVSGRRFLELLIERARAGVEVRLLYDAIGSVRINAKLVRALVKAGGRAHAFHPMNPLRRRFAAHLRNHRKLIVCDGETGFVGGMNIGDEYFRRRRRHRAAARQPYRDTHLRLRGPCLEALARTFAEDWNFAAEEKLDLPRPPPPAANGLGSIVAVVPSGPHQEYNASQYAYFAAISSARRRVYLTTPYFIPDDAGIAALVSAALRRVDVRVLVPYRSNDRIAELAARSYYGELLRGGVRIYEYEPAMLHAKTLVVDGHVAIVGSANADIRSWRLNFELGAMVADPAFARKLEESFVRDLAQSHEVTLEVVARRDWKGRVAQGVARLLSPLL
jgi:cardiolipin synthase A/B